MKRYINLLSVISLWLIIGLSSCRDDVLYDPITGDGESTLSFDMRFESIVPALDDTRTGGTSIKKIHNVTVIVYDQSGKLYNIYRSANKELVDFTVVENSNTNLSPGRPEGTKTTEQGTDVATFKLNNIPFGKYYFYVVANYDIADKDVQTPEDLKDILVEWKENIVVDNVITENNVAKNNAMFGYFRSSDSENSLGFEAPQVTVSKANLNLFAWVRRLASKVTIAFDPSGLNELVYVYIKSVTIHDIPKKCYLGKNNEPDSYDDLIRNGETIFYGDGATSDEPTKWLRLHKYSGIQGAKGHTDNQDALFFFENMQGDYEGKRDYYKPQIKGETGTSINDPEYNEDGQTIKNDFKDRIKYGTYIEVEAYYSSRNPEQFTSGPIKYRFMLGQNITYNYNAERNHHYKLTLQFKGWANEPDWHIVYEEPTPTIFLPEQYYISYLYNQSMEMPLRIVGPDGEDIKNYYVSSEIIENNWIPYDPDTQEAPKSQIGALTDVNGFAWYEQAYNDYYKNSDGTPVNYFGFLTMRLNQETIVGNYMSYGAAANDFIKRYYLGEEASYTYPNPDNPSELLPDRIQVSPRWWAKYSLESEGTHLVANNQGDGEYKVEYGENNSTNLTVPFFTRAKELVPMSDFTGNNVFDAYQRKAVVRFRLHDKRLTSYNNFELKEEGEDVPCVPFKIRDSQGNEEEVSYRDIPIYQVRRVVNPKAIWRAAYNDAPFHVKLMHLDDADATTFTPFDSEGKWRVSVLAESEDFIRINGEKLNKGEFIEGKPDNKIEFDYKPKGTIDSNKTRSGIIKIEYHDYSCIHLIFVRQGYDAAVTLGDSDWSCYNAIAAQGNGTSTIPQDLTTTRVEVTKSPLSIGSFFKRCQYNYAILEENNATYGWLTRTGQFKTAYINNNKKIQTRNASWGDFGGYAWKNSGGADRSDKEWATDWEAINLTDNLKKELQMPTMDDYRSLRNSCEFGYGVVYADEASETAGNISDAYGFIDYNNDGKDDSGQGRGMRACLVYDLNTGNHVIFPLGSVGQGRRAVNTTFGNVFTSEQVGNGSLTYSSGRGLLSGGTNVYRPLTYNLYRDPGAVYWFRKPGYKDYAPNGESRLVAAWDINYHTLVFNPYAHQSQGENYAASTSSDALPIKLIYKK